MSEEDIKKFQTKFELKYNDYVKKFGKGLPGGIKADVVRDDLTRRFGADAARYAMKNISNIDYKTDLSP